MNNLPLSPLWKHQEEAISKAGTSSTRFALLFDPGCGKTRTAIEIYKKSRKYIGPVGTKKGKTLILAPLNVCRNWQNEIKMYLGANHETFLVAGGAKPKKLKAIDAFKDSLKDIHLFLICNIESVRSGELKAAIMKCGASFIIIDEFHNFKSPSSQQTKGLLDIIQSLKPTHVLPLTGTPAPQGEMDLWSLFTVLKATDDTFFLWRKKYFIDKNERRRGMMNYWPDYAIHPKAKVYFQELLAKHAVTAKKDDVLDLPDLLRSVMYAELAPEQQRHYDSMKEYLFAIDADGNELNASNMLSRTLRLQQILAGYIGDIAIRDNQRLRVLKEAIEKTNSAQFLIWTIFKATYKDIAAVLDNLGIRFGMLTGEQSAEERFEAMNAFQAGDLRALIAHPKAGGVGVNLTAASFSIHYTRSYSLTDDLQAEARNYRGGSERHKRIVRIDIVSPDTIDEEIMEALKEKKTVQEFVMGLKAKKEVYIGED